VRTDGGRGDFEQRRFLRRVVIVIGIVALLSIALVIVGLTWTAMLSLFAGVLIGVLLDGVAQFIEDRTRIPRLVALIFILLASIGAAVGAGFWLGPALAEHFSGFRDQLLSAWETSRTWLESQEWGQRLLDELAGVQVTSLLTPRFGGWLSTTVGVVAALVLAVVFGVYFAVNPDRYMQVVVILFPRRRRQWAQELLRSIARALRRELVGRFWSMSFVGVGTMIGLWIVGIPLAVPLGILAGLLSFVPNLGPIMAATPGLLVALAIDLETAFWVLIVYVAVQMLESYAVTPIVEQHVVSMPPALLLFFQVLMALSAGVIGLFMATPLLVAIVVIVQAVYLRDVLDDDVVLIGESDENSPRERRRKARKRKRAARKRAREAASREHGPERAPTLDAGAPSQTA
jgi:predicted PurR-regulated permease PerM